jgi:hypothetical protein
MIDLVQESPPVNPPEVAPTNTLPAPVVSPPSPPENVPPVVPAKAPAVVNGTRPSIATFNGDLRELANQANEFALDSNTERTLHQLADFSYKVLHEPGKAKQWELCGLLRTHVPKAGEVSQFLDIVNPKAPDTDARSRRAAQWLIKKLTSPNASETGR